MRLCFLSTVAMCETTSAALFNNICSTLLDLQRFLSYNQLRHVLVPTLLDRVCRPTCEDQAIALTTIGRLGKRMKAYTYTACVGVCVLSF